MIHLSHQYMTTGKTIAFTRQPFISKVMSLLLSILSRSVLLLSSKEQAYFNFTAAVTICSDFRVQENKAHHCFHCFCFHCFPHLPWRNGIRCHDLSFCWVSCKLFYSPLSPSSRGSLIPLCFLPWGSVICIFEIIDICSSNLDSSFCFIQPGISRDVLCV